MKSIHSLMIAGFCALAMSLPAAAGELRKGAETAADRVSWTDVMSGKWFGPVRGAHQPDVKVVEIELDPATAKVPGVIATILPEYDALIDSVREVVAKDPAVSLSLKEQGLSADDVLGLTRGADGSVSVFVGSSA
jgi:hypothetical protein